MKAESFPKKVKTIRSILGICAKPEGYPVAKTHV